MPVRRFRTVEEMSRPHWRVAGDPELLRAIARVWAFGRRSGVHHFPPGVYRARSVEEINERSERWNRANFQAFIEARRQGEGGTAPGAVEAQART